MIKRLIIVHGTGRCGTALLSYYFGGAWPDRSSWARRNCDRTAIAHEPLDHFAQYWECIRLARLGDSTGFLETVLLPQLRLLDGIDSALVADNKIGRWFSKELCNTPFEVKIIHLVRNSQDVVRSIEQIFGKNIPYTWCHLKSDRDRVLPKTDYIEALSTAEYHVAEVAERWMSVKAAATEAGIATFELPYEDFITKDNCRNELELFCGFRGYPQRLPHRVNTANNPTPVEQLAKNGFSESFPSFK